MFPQDEEESPWLGPPPHIVTEGLSWPTAGESRVRDHELEAQEQLMWVVLLVFSGF